MLLQMLLLLRDLPPQLFPLSVALSSQLLSSGTVDTIAVNAAAY
jgi:hypothetical protein